MITLEQWKERLEAVGIECTLWDWAGACLVLWLRPGKLGQLLRPDCDDASNAEAIARVKNHVHGEWAYFVPSWPPGMGQGWRLMGAPTVRPGFILGGNSLGFAPTQLECQVVPEG